MTRRRVTASGEVGDAMVHKLATGETGYQGNDDDCLFWWIIPDCDPEARRAWEQVGQELTAEYAKANPGRRPFGWWLFAAPEPFRQRLGGTGEVCPLPHFAGYQPLPWPHLFIDSLARSNRFGLPELRGIDPEDPARYESQPSYLRRHKLLSAIEARKLKPSDFEPELVTGVRSV